MLVNLARVSLRALSQRLGNRRRELAAFSSRGPSNSNGGDLL